MMRKSAYRSLRTVAVVAAMATLLALAYIVDDELGASAGELPTPGAIQPSAASGDILSKPPRFQMPPARAFTAIVERPLFTPSRRPPADHQAATELGDLALVGVLISPGVRTAVVAHGHPRVLTHVVEGQNIAGWSVASIGPDHIMLRHGATEQALKLVADDGTATTQGFRPLKRK